MCCFTFILILNYPRSNTAERWDILLTRPVNWITVLTQYDWHRAVHVHGAVQRIRAKKPEGLQTLFFNCFVVIFMELFCKPSWTLTLAKKRWDRNF